MLTGKEQKSIKTDLHIPESDQVLDKDTSRLKNSDAPSIKNYIHIPESDELLAMDTSLFKILNHLNS